MTPFDPVALLAMLLTFYPAPSAAALARARAERPEYFAGGEITSTSRDKIRLPDGRVFDLIFDVDGVSGGPRWQVIEPSTGDAPEPWPLEPGGLDPIDIDAVAFVPLTPGFAAMAAAGLGELAASAGVLGLRHSDIAAHASADAVDGPFRIAVEHASRSLYAHIAAFGDLNPAPLTAQSDGVVARVNATESDFPAEPPSLGEIPGNAETPDNPGQRKRHPEYEQPPMHQL